MLPCEGTALYASGWTVAFAIGTLKTIPTKRAAAKGRARRANRKRRATPAARRNR
jgi:hypothetical protein